MLIYLIYLSMLFVPFGSKTVGISIGPVQLSPYRLCILLAFALHIIKTSGKIKFSGKGITGYSMKFMLVWLAYSIVSSLWAKDISSWLRVTLFITFGTVSMIMFIHYFNSKDRIIKAAVFFELGIFAQSMIGWYEVITRNYRFVEMGTSISDANYRNYIATSYRIPIAMQSNPNNFALLMFVGIFVALFLFVNSNNKRKKVICLIMASNCTILAFLTISRAVILGIFISVLCLTLYIGKKKFSAVAGIICIAIIIMPYVLRYVSSFMSFTFNVVNGSDSVRVNLIRVSLADLLKTYGFGVGAGQIDYWLGIYNGPIYIERIANVHNWWAEVLSNYGVIIFVGYLFFYFGILFFLRRKSKAVYIQESKSCNVLAALLVGFVLASTSPSSLVIIEWFWLFMSFLVAYISYLESGLYFTEFVGACDII